MSHFFPRNLKRVYPVIESANGVWVQDNTGFSYLDGCSGAVCTNIGHCLPEINDAITAQMRQVAFAHTSQFVSLPALELADKLIKIAPNNFQSGRVYFTSGGSEAVETAIKMARSYFIELGKPDKTICISRQHSYHGSTLGALAMTGHLARRHPYIPLLKDKPYIRPAYPYRCPCGFTPGPCTSKQCSIVCANELEETIKHIGPDNILAFIAEPIVGAALGAVVPYETYWSHVAKICKKYNVLLIADEVMTGLGRTGTYFAVNHWGIEPDIITLGKGIAAGYMPLGAVLAASGIVEAFENGSGIFEHGFTYSGHPLACAAGVAVMEYLAGHKLIQKVAKNEQVFFQGLNELYEYEIVGDIRGRGFMAGIEFVQDRLTKEPFSNKLKVNQIIAHEAQRAGLLVYPGSSAIDGIHEDHIMVSPPFTINDTEMEELFKRLKIAIKNTVHILLASKI